MRVEDYCTEERRAWFRPHEKGGKRHTVPAHHNSETCVDACLEAADVAGQKKYSLFSSIDAHRAP
jgi:integrase/recombinase XerD